MLLLLNYQNRDKPFYSNLISINLPIVISQLITYPLLKLQTQLLTNNTHISFNSLKYHFKYLLKNQQYPKILQGIRYSIDHSITYATARFFILDWIVKGLEKVNSVNNITFAASVLGSSLLATLIGQPSLVQRTVASSLPKTDIESFTSKMKSLDYKKVITVGLKYSIPLNILSTSLDMFYLYFFRDMIQHSIQTQAITGIAATFLISCFIHPLHYLRVAQIKKVFLNKTQDVNYRRAFDGIETSLFRRGINNSILLGLYLSYNFYSTQKQNQTSFQNRSQIEPQSYRQGSERNKVRSIFDF